MRSSYPFKPGGVHHCTSSGFRSLMSSGSAPAHEASTSRSTQSSTLTFSNASGLSGMMPVNPYKEGFKAISVTAMYWGT